MKDDTVIRERLVIQPPYTGPSEEYIANKKAEQRQRMLEIMPQLDDLKQKIREGLSELDSMIEQKLNDILAIIPKDVDVDLYISDRCVYGMLMKRPEFLTITSSITLKIPNGITVDI